MILPGRVTIARSQHSDGSNSIHIEIVDSASGIHFVDARLTLEDFAAAVTGAGHTPASLEVRGLEKVGLNREYKTERIIFPYRHAQLSMRLALAQEAVAPFELDGWSAQDPLELYNSHRLAPGERDVYLVGFHRWVQPEGGAR